MKHGSLFSGIGGFDLAAQWMGWENVLQCEIDKFCNKVLEKNFPDVRYRYTDITKTDFTVHRGEIDIFTGGFPCQPFSSSGKRLGGADERFLFPEMLRAIREVKPKWIVAENVRGLATQKFSAILKEIYSSLETQGYKKIITLLIPATAVGAHHERKRVWIVANSDSNGLEGEQKENEYAFREQLFATASNTSDSFSHNPQLFRLGDYRGVRKNDGIPNWVDRIHSIGNSIVPQIAFEIFRAIEETEIAMITP